MNSPEARKRSFKKIKERLASREAASMLLILVFLAVALSSIFISPQLYRWSVHEGDVALKDIYAPYDFKYFWEVDEEATGRAREEAADAVPVVLERDLVTEEGARAGIDQFFDVLGEEQKKETSLYEKTEELKGFVDEGVSEWDLGVLLEQADLRTLKKKTLLILDNVFLAGYIDSGELDSLREKDVQEVLIFNENTDAELRRARTDLVEKGNVNSLVGEYARRQFEDDRKTRRAVAELVSAYIRPNLVIDENRTVERKEAAVRKVKPVLKTWSVKKNELIIEKGKRVNAHHITQLGQLRRVFRPGTTPTFFLGVLLLFVLLGLVSVIYLSSTRKKNFLRNTKDIGITLLNMFGLLVVADVIMRSPQPSYFIPMAAMGMMIALLVGFEIAFLSVLSMSVLISLMIGGKIEVTLVLLVGSVVGMYAVRETRRRAKILLAGILVGLGKLAALTCIGLINGMKMDYYITDGLWCLASGLLSGFIVMGLLPVFEHFFKVPTNISLLELSDLNHPLLKKLAMEAPGTYHHSIMVGNLAESACDAIGANSLLARVGAYYHDIGKIPKAEYFSENEMGGPSRHSNLAPSMSALIIAKHVKEGVEIARKYKLNRAMIDFITQHHGDSLISFFYQKAIEKSEDGTVLKEDDFRYPGPKPQTKEGAIILLADSVEASSRALDDPTPSRIRNLVKKIINNKFIDGQLDDCDLTLRDMNKIAESFVRVLMGTFHTRLDYPDNAAKPSSNGVISNGGKNKQRKQKPKEKD